MSGGELRLNIVAGATEASGAVNDDRIGEGAGMAWVIDGATDLVEAPLVGKDSDAAWLADLISQWIASHGACREGELADMLPALTAHAARAFQALQRRPPAGRQEHPSAAGLIVRLSGAELAYLAVADCALVVRGNDGSVQRYGQDEETAGDHWLLAQVRALQEGEGALSGADLRARLMPAAREARARMNRYPGYGVFSITEPPPAYVMSGRVAVAAGSRLLLATDGFMRLVDFYGSHTARELLDQTFERGPEAMMRALRDIEAGDADCRRYPRLKARDDASVIIATVETV